MFLLRQLPAPFPLRPRRRGGLPVSGQPETEAAVEPFRPRVRLQYPQPGRLRASPEEEAQQRRAIALSPLRRQHIEVRDQASREAGDPQGPASDRQQPDFAPLRQLAPEIGFLPLRRMGRHEIRRTDLPVGIPPGNSVDLRCRGEVFFAKFDDLHFLRLTLSLWPQQAAESPAIT